MLDAHCHLNDRRFCDDLDAVLARMTDAGVEGALVVGFDVPSSEVALAMARAYPDRLRAAVGVHPHDNKELDDAGLAQLRALAADPLVVAMGEIGLDYHYDHSPREVQREAFRRQLGLAATVGLPIIIHEREAEADVRAILDAENGWARGGVWHCCSVSPASAVEIARYLYIGIAGWITFPKMAEIRALVAAVPLDRLLVETDAPYITPVPYRGKRNEPAYLPHTVAKVAEVKGVGDAIIAQTTDNNTRRAFPRWGGERSE